MTLEEYEDHLRPRLDHGSVAELPGFPVSEFTTLQQLVSAGRYTLGIDFTIANRLATHVYGAAWALMTVLPVWAPVLISLAAVVGALLSARYWLFAALPVSFLGFFLANPYNPARKFFTLVALVAAASSVWALASQRPTLGLVLLAFVVPFWMIRIIYRVNQNRLRSWALRSEILTIALYEEGKLGIMDRQTGETYWAPLKGAA